MCGVVGIFSHRPVARELCESLIQLQHRGQDAAGIMTYDDRMHKEKGLGLVRDVFTDQNVSLLTGNVGIGHTRYPTHGGFSHGEVQPFWTEVPFGIALAHNGNLTNYPQLARFVTDHEKRYLNTTSDTELLLHLFAGYLERNGRSKTDEQFFDLLCNSVRRIARKASGSYSAIAMIVGRGLVAFRDPFGIRPLVLGARKNPDGTTDTIVASETTMFYALGFERLRDVAPGEVIYVSPRGQLFSKILGQKQFTPCIFEYVYFARPDSVMNDISVYRARLRLGQNLALRWKVQHPNRKPDIVIPAPSTANTAALSLAHELGVRYSEGLYKNPFIGRTFIMPEQGRRQESVRFKLSPQEFEIRGKRVMVVDDSIVRGTTCREIVKMVRNSGALEVYFVSTFPPIISPCFYGVDFPTKSELIAANRSEEEIRKYIGADALMFQRDDDLVEAVTRKGEHHIDRPCMACLDGKYVTGGVTRKVMAAMEAQRNAHRDGK